jgi:hypothetical protein
MKDISILQQVKHLNLLVAEDRLQASDFPALLENGLNSDVIDTWHLYEELAKVNNTTVHSLIIRDIEKASRKPSFWKRVLKKIGL